MVPVPMALDLYLKRAPKTSYKSLKIRIGFGCILYYNDNNRNPQNPVLGFKAPTLVAEFISTKECTLSALYKGS